MDNTHTHNYGQGDTDRHKQMCTRRKWAHRKEGRKERRKEGSRRQTNKPKKIEIKSRSHAKSCSKGNAERRITKQDETLVNMQPEGHRHTDGHTHSMESWGNWGSVCLYMCVTKTKK